MALTVNVKKAVVLAVCLCTCKQELDQVATVSGKTQKQIRRHQTPTNNKPLNASLTGVCAGVRKGMIENNTTIRSPIVIFSSHLQVVLTLLTFQATLGVLTGGNVILRRCLFDSSDIFS